MPVATLFSNLPFPPDLQPQRFKLWIKISHFLDHKGIMPRSFPPMVENALSETFHLGQILQFLHTNQKKQAQNDSYHAAPQTWLRRIGII